MMGTNCGRPGQKQEEQCGCSLLHPRDRLVWYRVWDAGGENTVDSRYILRAESIALVDNGCSGEEEEDVEGARESGEVRRKRRVSWVTLRL